jgi:hypothetical protein
MPLYMYKQKLLSLNKRSIQSYLAESSRLNKRSIQPYLSVEKGLKKALLHERSRGRLCRLDKVDGLFGPGIRFKDGSLLLPQNWMRFQLAPRGIGPLQKIARAPLPSLRLWQGKFLKLLKAKKGHRC